MSSGIFYCGWFLHRPLGTERRGRLSLPCVPSPQDQSQADAFTGGKQQAVWTSILRCGHPEQPNTQRPHIPPTTDWSLSSLPIQIDHSPDLHHELLAARHSESH